MIDTTQNAERVAASEAEYVAASMAVLSADATGSPASSFTSLGVTLLAEFNQAENDRRDTELRWLQDLRQYRGQYDPDVLAKIGPNRSRAFVRKTRVKVKTVNARCMDLLFPANSTRNWDLKPTPRPTVTPEQRQQITRLLIAAAQPPAPQPGQPPAPPTPPPSKDDIDKAVQQMVDTAAGEMLKTIDDQLAETRYKDVAKSVINSGNLYGTGVLKAPLVERKVRQRFVKEGVKWKLITEHYTVPFVEYVPLWRFFPDMTATNLEDCRYVYERHLMTKVALLKLAERKSFASARIKDYVQSNPNGQLRPRYYDSELKAIGERSATQIANNGQYEVFERWGWLDAESLISVGVKIPEDRRGETFFSNIWMLPSGEVIRAVLQPINGVTWPYHLYYFDKDETNIFGEGLSAIMRDDQTMLNAGVRMILDNAAITAGPQLEVNMRLMAKNEKADEMYPFKIWPRTGEEPNSPAIRVLEMPSHLAELQGIVQMFENNTDEVTAIPRYMSGENATQGAAGTASGMSMLMGAASIVMKDLISSFDEGITKPFITALYRWNMQFSKNDKIKGDFDVMASGATSMVAKEVRAQLLDNFAAISANPLDAPYVKRDKLLRQRAEAHDLVDVVKTEDEVRQEQDNPAAAAAAQMAQMEQELQMKAMQLNIATLEAKIAQLTAQTAQANADAMNKKLSAAYAAMEAAGIAVANPGVAAAGDALLRSAGWVDAPPTPQMGPVDTAQVVAPAEAEQPNGPVEVGAIPHERRGPRVGMHRGIETARLTDGQPATT